MIPVLRNGIEELPASRALRHVGLYFDNQLSIGATTESLDRYLQGIISQVNSHLSSLKNHGLVLAEQSGENLSETAITAVSGEVVFVDDTNEIAYFKKDEPFVENLVLAGFNVGRIALDTSYGETLYSDAHFWYVLRRLGEVGLSHYMNVSATRLVLPGVYERLS